MNELRSYSRWVLGLLLVLTALGLSACATTESDNTSVRPWNAPTGWENGIPSRMTEGR
jgi:hypothetical protein